MFSIPPLIVLLHALSEIPKNIRHVVSKSGHFTHDMTFFHHDVRRKRFNTHGELHYMEMTISKDHVAEKPRRDGTSGGMVAHDLVKAAEKEIGIESP